MLHYTVVSLILKWNSGLIREVVSLKGGDVVIFYYLSASEIWPYKKMVFLEICNLVLFYYMVMVFNATINYI